ncbi:monovalent cation/H+ antiporter complex subunit F [Ihubacter sp. rT4E-8]|uniref:monovalent cation/H+ antiporter complex subunit F n=1 Tax=unclassified Ihubacter TaxID=2633299 RepID=UPI00137AAE9C
MAFLFKFLLVGIIAIIGLMLIRVFRGPSVYDRLNGIFVMGIDVIVVIMLIGFIDGRADMYVDIAISYGILGFLSTVIIARFLGGRKKDDH